MEWTGGDCDAMIRSPAATKGRGCGCGRGCGRCNGRSTMNRRDGPARPDGLDRPNVATVSAEMLQHF